MHRLSYTNSVNKGVIMIKRYKFENLASKALMAEILTHRDRQPRVTFLSSLAAVMVTAISLTMVFGSLSTLALPLEQQQTFVSSGVDGETPSPEVVTRVYTETQTENVVVYNDFPQIYETLLLPDSVSTEFPSTGKSLFDQKKQLFQWQYGDEVFSFFVKDNTVYRRSETSGKTIVIYKGNGAVSLFCVTDRYLFFGAEVHVKNYDSYIGGSAYCYRADLLTGKILRLFNYIPGSNQNESEVFVRFDGTDVVFTHYIVHEDGNYERIPDKAEKSYDEEDDENPIIDLSLMLNDDNSIYVKDIDGNCYDLGISIEDIESLGYNTEKNCKSWLFDDGIYNAVFVSFNPDQNDSYKYVWYYGRITDDGIKGGLIQAEFLDKPEYSFFITISYNIIFGLFDDWNFYFLIDFDKLTSDIKSEREYHSFYDDELTLAVTYYPFNSLRAATPDSAESAE